MKQGNLLIGLLIRASEIGKVCDSEPTLNIDSLSPSLMGQVTHVNPFSLSIRSQGKRRNSRGFE